MHLCVVQLKSAVCHQMFCKEAFIIHSCYIELILHNLFCSHFTHRTPTTVRDICTEKGAKYSHSFLLFKIVELF